MNELQSAMLKSGVITTEDGERVWREDEKKFQAEETRKLDETLRKIAEEKLTKRAAKELKEDRANTKQLEESGGPEYKRDVNRRYRAAHLVMEK